MSIFKSGSANVPFDFSVLASSGQAHGPSNRRVPGLDGLRALSILMVLLGHFFFSGRGGGAALGVYIFFSISGFLITRLLFLEFSRFGRVSVSAFYCRRFFRLVPVLVVYIGMVVVVQILHSEEVPLIEVFAVFLYFTNYLMSWLAMAGQEVSLPIGVLWSLAVEEHFYFIMPLFFVLARSSPIKMVRFSLVVIVFALVARVVYVELWPDVIGRLISYRNSETRIDSIAFGVLVAGMCELHGGRRILKYFCSDLALIVGVCFFLIAATLPGVIYKETLRFTLVSAGTVPILCSIVFGCPRGWIQRVSNSMLASWIGRLSYSLYVWHGGVVFFLCAIGFSPDFVKDSGVLKLFSTFLLAIASYFIVERPALAVGHRFSMYLQAR